MGVATFKNPSSVKIIICTVFSLALGIAGIVIALKGRDDECNVQHHNMDLDLTDFLLWFSVADLLSIPFSFVSLCVYAAHKTARRVGYVAFVVAFLILLFRIAWGIVGAIILFQDCIFCIHEQRAIGVMSLVTLIIHWCAATHFVTFTNSNSDE